MRLRFRPRRFCGGNAGERKGAAAGKEEIEGMTDWKARALAAERRLEEVYRHHHPMPDYYPGCSACEEDRQEKKDVNAKGGG